MVSLKTEQEIANFASLLDSVLTGRSEPNNWSLLLESCVSYNYYFYDVQVLLLWRQVTSPHD